MIAAIVAGSGDGGSQTQSASVPGQATFSGPSETPSGPVRLAGSLTPDAAIALDTGGQTPGLAADGPNVWASDPAHSRLLLVGPKRSLGSFSVPGAPDSVAVAPSGEVWVTIPKQDLVVALDPSNGARRTIPVGHTPRGIAVGGGAVWVASVLDPEDRFEDHIADTLTAS